MPSFTSAMTGILQDCSKHRAAWATLLATAAYVLWFVDPYPALLAAPFFALGVGRGRPLSVVAALSLVPAIALLALSTAKYAAIGVPLLASDRYFLKANLLALAYNDWRVAVALLLLLGGGVWYFRVLLSGKGKVTQFEKGALAALAIGCVVCVWGYRQGFDASAGGAQYPRIKTLVKSAHISRAHLHTLAAVDAIGAPESQDGPTELVAPAHRPDIFLILEESTFPPAMLAADYSPTALFAHTASQQGPLKVPTYGGGTWITEFAVTVQMRPAEFGNSGLYVFHQLDGRLGRSIFTELKKVGYRTMVFYPTFASFINAKSFYTSIGVDDFYDAERLGIASGWNWKIPDRAMYEAMLRTVDEVDGPVVAIMLTIDQHGPHDSADPFADYLRRFENSDRDYAEFLSALGKRGSPAGVVVFGDHQPVFTADLIDEEQQRLTAYEIRCVGFECSGPTAASQERPLDAVLLAADALTRFGFTLDEFSRRERELLEPCDDDTDACEQHSVLAVNTLFAHYFH